MDTTKDTYSIDDLKDLMAHLRDRDHGCPWDVDQSFETIKPHTIEEAYEVADAIERGSMDDLKDELGDLLFQVIFHAQMAAEQGAFTIDDVINHVTKKMIFRQPHVFGDETATTADAVKNDIWEQQKAKEKGKSMSVLDSVTLALPSLLLAHKIQKKVRKAGFRYADITDVFDKLNEEISELMQAITEDNKKAIEEEYGDVLLVSALLGAHLDINPEETLRAACHKFIKRFQAMENHLDDTISDASLSDKIAAWDAVKKTA